MERLIAEEFSEVSKRTKIHLFKTKNLLEKIDKVDFSN